MQECESIPELNALSFYIKNIFKLYEKSRKVKSITKRPKDI